MSTALQSQFVRELPELAVGWQAEAAPDPEPVLVNDALAAELGLGIPDITWHTIRDNFSEATGLLALPDDEATSPAFDAMLD